ncbi:hypothetical protein [Streptomyces alboflavus]|uniref:hypothetical protein n=1 Tax=Streptomyces alboflavus TaxID=67267 RepID=UPI000F658FFB|nr:hypothetical protein [Streptomyces alboflavus]
MPEPVSGRLGARSWSSQTSVAYEAAIEAIGSVVGAYSALIAEQEERPEGEQDQGAIEQWEQAQAACQRERQNLNPQDGAQVARVRAEYAARFRELTAEAR